MLEIFSLCTGYAGNEILHNVSLNCEKGKITTLIGPNGSGKSILLKSVIGMLPIQNGEIKIDGVSVQELPENIRAQKIAYLSQGKNIPDITVSRMVLHGRFPYLSYPRKYRRCDYAAAKTAMITMGINELADLPLSELSGGMRQKVYIAMALCQEASVIMLDEPTTYLDISQQFKITELLKDLTEKGKTVLTVSHDILSSLKVSDRIAVLQDGVIRTAGTPKEILQSAIIPDVFGVDIVSFEKDGICEYFYKNTEGKL